MPKKGYRQTPAHKLKISLSLKGHKQSKTHVRKKALSSRKTFLINGTDKISIAKIADRNPMWKGESAGMEAKHLWIVRRFGKAKEHGCYMCNRQAEEWSNIDHKYRRRIEDFKPLCRKCHKKYDKNMINQKTPLDKIVEKFDEKFRDTYYGKDINGFPIYPPESFVEDVKDFLRQACQDYANSQYDEYRNLLLTIIKIGKDRGKKRDVILYNNIEAYLKSSKFI